MSVSPKVLISSKQAESVQTTQYTATGVKALIDKFTVANTTAGAVTLTINLVPSGDSAATSNVVVEARSIAANSTEIITELAGHVLEAGGFISTIAGAATSLNIRCSGREVT